MSSNKLAPVPQAATSSLSQRVVLSPWVNEPIPPCGQLVSTHELARLTRYPRWLMLGLMIFGRFPRQRRFHGRAIGWLRSEVLAWIERGTQAVRHQHPDAATGASREAANTFEILTERASSSPAYYRIRDVLRITALSRPTLYRRIAARRFPPPVHLGGRACGWRATALQAWIADPEGYRAPPGAEPETRRGPGRPRKYLPA